MIKKYSLALALIVITGWWGVRGFAQRGEEAAKWTEEVAAAGQKFLSTLDEAQRDKVVYEFDDSEQRQRWSNLPEGAVRRGGLQMGDLTQPQRDAAMAVLKAALSSQGYDKTVQIVEADEVLRGGAGRGRGGRGGGPGFGRDNYFISFLGQPSATSPWMIQFGGHHLGLNITLAGEHGTLAPSHTGAQPATYELEGKTLRPLGREVDKAFELLSSLDEGQRKQAVLTYQVRNLVLGPGRDGEMIQPEGVKGSSLTEKQREMLAGLAAEWTGSCTTSPPPPRWRRSKRTSTTRGSPGAARRRKAAPLTSASKGRRSSSNSPRKAAGMPITSTPFTATRRTSTGRTGGRRDLFW